MKIEPKILIKHYLNTALKPIIIDNVSFYKVYVRVGFKGNNNKLKSVIQDVFIDNETMQKDVFNEIESERKSIEISIKKSLFFNPNFKMYKNNTGKKLKFKSKILKLENEILKLKKQIEL